MDEHGKLRTGVELKKLTPFKYTILSMPKNFNAKLPVLTNALASAGINSPEQWKGDFTRVIRRQLGKTKLWVVFGNGIIKVKLSARAYLYDARSHKYLGNSDSAVLDMSKLPKGSAFVLAQLPFKSENLTLSMESDFERGDAVNYKLLTKPSEGFDSVVRVDVYRPDKSLAEDCSNNIVISNGRAMGKFQLGLNAQEGKWKVVATDVITGIRSEFSFTVKSRSTSWWIL